MEDVLKKISQYQLFNFLMSGAILVMALAKTTSIDPTTDDAVLSFFVHYFAGMVVSRIGSIAVEPVLKRLKIIRFRPYTEYIEAASKDAKIDTLSQENNTYRTIVATFLVYIAVFYADHFAQPVLQGKHVIVTIGLSVLIIVLFAFAYHKQTKYITQRIQKALNPRQ